MPYKTPVIREVATYHADVAEDVAEDPGYVVCDAIPTGPLSYRLHGSWTAVSFREIS